MQAQPQQPSQAYSYGMQTQQPQYYTLMPAPGVPAATAAYVPYAVAPAVAAVPGSASTLAGSGQGTGLRNSPYFGAGYGQGDGQSPLESPAGYPEMVQGIGSGSRGRPTVAYMAQPSRASVPRFPPQMTAIAQMPTVAALPYPAPSGMYQQPYVYAAAPTQSLLRPKITHGLQQDVGYLPGYNMNFPFLGSPSSPGPVELDDTPITNIYIRGLPSTMTDEQLHEMCKGYGHIVSSKAIIDIRTNECKGYGFVMYETQDQARQAMSELSRTGYQVSFAKESFSARLKNLQDSGSTNIYLSNIPMSMTEEGLAELFSPMKVVSQKILRDNNGVSRGVGFIRFDTREDAVEAIDKFHGMTLPGGTAPLQVRFSDSPAQKKLKIQVAAKRKIMARTPGSGGPFAFRRRSEMEEQYLYASAGPDFYMTSMPMAAYATSVPVAVAPDLAGGPLPMFGWPGTVPVMQSVAPVAVLPLQGPSFSGTEPGSPQSISDRASGTPPTSAEGGLRPDGHGRLRVPRSPSDLGQSAEISAASDDGGYDYGSGDLDELTVRVKELIAYDVENKVGSGRSLSLDGKRTGATPTGGRGDGNLLDRPAQ